MNGHSCTKGVQLRPEKHMYFTWLGDVPSCFPSVGMLSWFHFSPSRSSGHHSLTSICKHPPGTAFFPNGKPVRNFWVPPKPSLYFYSEKGERSSVVSNSLWPHELHYTVHGIFQARILEWVGISSSRGSSQPRERTQVSRIAGGFFTNWASVC